MSHYKSNVRDQVFNLFEVFGVDKALGEGAYADLDADTAREMLAEIGRLAEGPIAESFAEGDRNPPVFDPDDPHRHAARAPSRSRSAPSSTAAGTRSASTRNSAACRCPAPCSGPSWSTSSAPTRPCTCTRWVPASRDLLPPGHRRAEEVGHPGRRARLDLHHGAHRARRGLRRRRRPHQGRPAGRRHLAHRRREALHHLRRRRRPRREHPAPGAGPPRGRRTGHQGSVAVLRAEVPLRPRDR